MQKKWKTPLFDLKSEFPSKIIDLLAEDVAVSHGIELLRFVHRRLQSGLIVVRFLKVKERNEKYRQVDIAFKAGLTRKSFFQPPLPNYLTILALILKRKGLKLTSANRLSYSVGLSVFMVPMSAAGVPINTSPLSWNNVAQQLSEASARFT